MSDIKVFGTSNEAIEAQRIAHKILDAGRLELDNLRRGYRAAAPPPRYLPCGHSEAQAAWLGCTEDECRPGDTKISAEYAQVRAMRERHGG